MLKFFKHGGAIVWLLLLGLALCVGLSVKLAANTAVWRYRRDVTRMVFNDNVGLLNDMRAKLGIESDSVRRLLETPPSANAPYIVISIADHQLWYKQGDSVLFTAPVATASGKSLVASASGQQWRFETPRGRLRVIDKDMNPAWVPPDWHFIEQAHKRGLGVVHMVRGQTLRGSDGSTYSVRGSNIVRTYPDGHTVAVPPPHEGKELVVGGNVVVPPFGTNQRRYMGVLGTRRLDLGDGYGIHGTDNPASIGHSVSHGCVRMRNADVEALYPMVPIGTSVFIY
jgi:hypothetical protein